MSSIRPTTSVAPPLTAPPRTPAARPAETEGPRISDQATLSAPPRPAAPAEAPAPTPAPPAEATPAPRSAAPGGVRTADIPRAHVSPTGGLAILEEAATPSQPDPRFVEKYGPWALVTGASQGIGAEYARQLAAKGMNVVLVARSADKLESLAKELQQTQGVQVRAVPADLSDPTFIDGLQAATRDLEVGLLVNNAGSWDFGSFLEHDPQHELKNIRVNVEAPMLLTHAYAGKMAERGKGGVLNVGSGAGLHGVPGQANYSATKGYMLNLTESLFHELKPKGIDVEIVNPGPVVGEASQSVYNQSKIPLQKVTAGEVVEHSLDKLGKKCSTIPGWFNRLAMFVALRVLPRDVNAAIAGQMLERASQH